jgi:hypothetical protein
MYNMEKPIYIAGRDVETAAIAQQLQLFWIVTI